MKYTHFLFCLWICLCYTAQAQNKYGVVVGINDYFMLDAAGKKVPDADNSKLKGCVNDAKSIKQLLVSRFGFSEGNIKKIYNYEATAENIRKEIKLMLAKSRKGDIAVFYFSGHGVSFPHVDASAGIHWAEAICPADFRAGPKSNFIEGEELAYLFAQFVKKGVTLTSLFDCCHSNSTVRIEKSKINITGIRKILDPKAWEQVKEYHVAMSPGPLIIKEFNGILKSDAWGKHVECDGKGNQKELEAWLNNHGDAEAMAKPDCPGSLNWTNKETGSDTEPCSTSRTFEFYVKDSCGGIESTSASFVIKDKQPLILIKQASDTTITCCGQDYISILNGWLNRNGGADAFDVCGAVSWSNNFDDYKKAFLDSTGSIQVTFTAFDGCHTVSTTAAFFVEDQLNPNENLVSDLELNLILELLNKFPILSSAIQEIYTDQANESDPFSQFQTNTSNPSSSIQADPVQAMEAQFNAIRNERAFLWFGKTGIDTSLMIEKQIAADKKIQDAYWAGFNAVDSQLEIQRAYLNYLYMRDNRIDTSIHKPKQTLAEIKAEQEQFSALAKKFAKMEKEEGRTSVNEEKRNALYQILKDYESLKMIKADTAFKMEMLYAIQGKPQMGKLAKHIDSLLTITSPMFKDRDIFNFSTPAASASMPPLAFLIPGSDSIDYTAFLNADSDSLAKEAKGFVAGDTSYFVYVPYEYNPPSKLPGSNFLFMSATDDLLKGVEKMDENQQPHGAFTKALLSVLRDNPASMKSPLIFDKITQQLSERHIPHKPSMSIATNRWSGNLFGVDANSITEKLTAKCIQVYQNDKNKIVLDKGLLAGLSKGNVMSYKDNGSPRDYEIIDFIGEDKSLAKYKPDFRTGVFSLMSSGPLNKEITLTDGYTISSKPLVKVYIPDDACNTSCQKDILNTYVLPRINKKDPHFIPFDQSSKSCTKIFMKGKTFTVITEVIQNVRSGNSNVPVKKLKESKPLQLTDLQQTTDKTGNYFLYLPVPDEVTGSLKNTCLKDQNMEIVSDPLKSNLSFYCTYSEKLKSVIYVVTDQETTGANRLNRIRDVPYYYFSATDKVTKKQLTPQQIAENIYATLLLYAAKYGWLNKSPRKN